MEPGRQAASTEVERLFIAETLKLTGGNREEAAEMLGIGERTLYRKIKEYRSVTVAARISGRPTISSSAGSFAQSLTDLWPTSTNCRRASSTRSPPAR